MEEGPDPAGQAAFQSLVLRRLDEIRDAQLAARSAPAPPVEGTKSTAGVKGTEDAKGTEGVEVAEGAATIAARYTAIQRSAHREILALAAGPVVAVPAGANNGQREAMRAGVRYRVVYERDALDLDRTDTPLLLHEWSALGEEMRVAFDVPMKLVMADRARALVVPAPSDGVPPRALVLDSPALLTALGWIFDRVWESALPVPAALASAVDGPLTSDDKQLLTLLLNGYTDQAIGSQLGVSMRTVQRRVRRLLALAGAQSRLQLGWHAAQHHWI
ncbi:LuxR C-terminal-related transcriptional regulator [Streptomyces sp. NPDC056470]|uniref:helix-turn-helix transcriptional regulator n=1 Tax=unclassified Streptomyces TaxID=2593676 RepID=UPI0036BA2026